MTALALTALGGLLLLVGTTGAGSRPAVILGAFAALLGVYQLGRAHR